MAFCIMTGKNDCCFIMPVSGIHFKWISAADIAWHENNQHLLNNAHRVEEIFAKEINSSRILIISKIPVDLCDWQWLFNKFIYFQQHEPKKVKFSMMVSEFAHKNEEFVDKARLSGCKQVFVRPKDKLEEIDNNSIKCFKEMVQAWQGVGVRVSACFEIDVDKRRVDEQLNCINNVLSEVAFDYFEFDLVSAQENIRFKCGKINSGMKAHDQIRELYALSAYIFNSVYSKKYLLTMVKRMTAIGFSVDNKKISLLFLYIRYNCQKIMTSKVIPQYSDNISKKNRISKYLKVCVLNLKEVASATYFYTKLNIIILFVKLDSKTKEYMDKAIFPIN